MKDNQGLLANNDKDKQVQGLNLPIQTFHITIVGDCGVGKTSMLNRYFNNKIQKHQITTDAVKSIDKIVKNEDQYLKLCFHDTPGAKFMRPMVSKYMEIAHIVIIVVSKINQNTWLDIIKERISQINGQQYVCLFINKIDKLKKQNELDQFMMSISPHIQKIEQLHPNFFFQVGSARKQKNDGIEILFAEILQYLTAKQRNLRDHIAQVVPQINMNSAITGI